MANPLASVAKGDLDLGKLEDETEKQAQESAAGEFKTLTDKIAGALSERVKEVRVTYRLTESPACLVSAENDMSGNLARLLKAAGQHAPAAKPTLEINPQHPVVQRLKAEAEREGSKFNDWASVLFDQALLAEGGQLDDPATFVKRMNQLMLEMRAG
jgi:molecular chaperone HtpG